MSWIWLHHFLKSIANKRASCFAITGDVRYAGIDHLEMTKQYNGEVVCNQEGTCTLFFDCRMAI